ncbi:unnamed protein product, partial [Staurois parvus]
MTERNQRMLKCKKKSCQLSAESIAKDLQTLYGLHEQQCAESFIERVSMAEQLPFHPSI